MKDELFTLTALLVGLASSQIKAGIIEGRVFDTGGASAISGIEVMIVPAGDPRLHSLTNKDGDYRISGITPDNASVRLKFEGIGYSPTFANVTLEHGAAKKDAWLIKRDSKEFAYWNAVAELLRPESRLTH